MYQQFRTSGQEHQPMMTEVSTVSKVGKGDKISFTDACAYLDQHFPEYPENSKTEIAQIISTPSKETPEEHVSERIRVIKTNPTLQAYCEEECKKLFGHSDLDAITVDQFGKFDDRTGCTFFHYFCTGMAGSPEERRHNAADWKDVNAGLYTKKRADARRASN